MALRISNTHHTRFQKHCCWRIWCRGTRVWGATSKPHIFAIVHFKHIHTSFRKTTLLAYLVQRYARLGRHVETPQFLALCISNTPTLGIQKQCCWHVGCGGMCVWGAMSKSHNFCHCAFQTHTIQGSKNTVAGVFGAEVRVFGAPRRNPTFLPLCISNTSILGIQKHCCWHVGCGGMCVWGATSKPHNVWHCAFQTHPY